MLAVAAHRAIGWIHRFLTEVTASVVMTACVAGATTAYLSLGGEGSPEPASAQAGPSSALFVPLADSGAPAFVRPSAPAVPASLPAVAPPRRPAPARPTPAPDVFAAPPVLLEAAAAFEDEPGLGPAGGASTYEPGAVTREALPPLPYAADETPERVRTLLGLPVPAAVPSDADIAAGARGLGDAVAGLVR